MSGSLFNVTSKINSRTEAQVQLSILGQFALRINGSPLSEPDNYASKRRSIISYLILHRERAVSQTELIEIFYEDENQINPVAALKMQIGRIRKWIGTLMDNETEVIISKRGSYQWNPALTCWVDSEVFESLCHEAKQEKTSDKERLSLYRQAMEIYTGNLVLEKDNLLWSKALSSRYHVRYISAVEQYAELLIRNDFYADAEAVCQRAIEKDPINERLYILLIQALLAQDKLGEAKVYYKSIVDTLRNSLGVHPSEELQNLYLQSMEVKKSWEQDLSVVMENMRDASGKREAFFCDFELFKNIYRLETRRANRDGGCLHIAMLTVFGMDGKVLSLKAGNVIMEQVQQTIVHNLRSSDVVAQYSACQFIIMLPYANLEDSQMVMDRVMNAYHKQNPKSAIRFSYQLRELELM